MVLEANRGRERAACWRKCLCALWWSNPTPLFCDSCLLVTTNYSLQDSSRLMSHVSFRALLVLFFLTVIMKSLKSWAVSPTVCVLSSLSGHVTEFGCVSVLCVVFSWLLAERLWQWCQFAKGLFVCLCVCWHVRDACVLGQTDYWGRWLLDVSSYHGDGTRIL